MLKKSHVIVSTTITASTCYELNIPLPATLCLMAGTYFGAELPDIDHPKSRLNRFLGPLGKLISRHVKHRTWTHTIWAIIFIAVMAFLVPAPVIEHQSLYCMGTRITFLRFLYFGIAIGYFLHIFEDSFSDLGICWTYPHRKYNFYRGHPYKKGHKHFWYYRTGGKEEACIRFISEIILILVSALLVLRG